MDDEHTDVEGERSEIQSRMVKSTYARARPQNFVIFYCFLSCMARVLARKTRWAQARKRECRSEVTCSKQQSVNKQLREIFTIFLPDGLR